MPRQPRIQFPGACYHVMARGDRRDPIVLDDDDRRRFVETFGQACAKCRWEVFAWVLMDNHYHFVIRTPEANLVDGMKWFQNTWTRRFNARHVKWGHLFGGRYKSILVEAPDDRKRRSGADDTDYLATLIDYVHLNPVRAGIVKPATMLDYRWSSLTTGYAVAASKRANWMNVESGLSLFGFPDGVAGRRRYAEQLEERARAESGEAGLSHPEGQSLQSTLRRGWYWGSEAFREKLLSIIPKARKLNRSSQSSKPGRAKKLQTGEEVLGEGLRWFRMDKTKAKNLPRGDLRRVAIAWAVHRRTCVPQKWIAQKLSMKSAPNVSQQVRRFESLPDRVLPKRVKEWRKRMLKLFE